MLAVLVSQNGCGVEGGSSQWNVSTKMPIRATALTGAGGRRCVGVEGKVASSVLGPGTQALLVAGVCGQSLAGRVLSCAHPYHLSGLALV